MGLSLGMKLDNWPPKPVFLTFEAPRNRSNEYKNLGVNHATLEKGRKLNRSNAHRKAMLRNMAVSLFRHERIETTDAKAKTIRSFAERLIRWPSAATCTPDASLIETSATKTC